MKSNFKLHYIIIAVSLIILFSSSSCKKKSEDPATIEKGIVTDVNGYVYNTVKIGNQWWMAEDLRTSKYRDSSFITSVPAPPIDTTWKHYTTGAYTNYLNNQGIVIGRFYNWYAISDPKGLAPKGWHIPNDAEWKELEKHLGMSADEADKTSWRGTHEAEKLKVIKGTINGWADYGNIWTTNETGFSAMPLGCRMFDGSWGDPGISATGFWWSASSSEEQSNKAWYRYLDYKNTNIFRYYGPKTYGFSVRCVKD